MYPGLTQSEALNKLKEYGTNEIVDVSKVTPLQILLRQIKGNFVLYMLFAATLISFFVGKDFTAYTVIAVIFAVIIVGFVQEYKAEVAISSLRNMLMQVSIVFRDGKKQEVPSKNLVPDDIIALGIGEKVPADCEILEHHELRLNESVLTGESAEVSKKAFTAETKDSDISKLFMGTFIVNGRCTAKILHTGMNTRFGKIAHLISTAEKELPLQKKINNIAKYMVTVALLASISTGLLMLFRAPAWDLVTLTDILILMVAIAVSAFPEGFPVVLIMTLAAGAKKMAARNAVVNRMSIIETLGETTIICSDKTGTITRGEMTVKFVFTDNALYNVEGSGYIAHGKVTKNDEIIDINTDVDLKALVEAGILCNDAEVERTGNDNEYKAFGTPTEAALLILGAKTGLFKESYDFKRHEEYPFNSERKMMSVLLDQSNQNTVKYKIFAKGAPEVLLTKCTKYLSNGIETDLDADTKQKILEMQSQMAQSAYRTLALAYKTIQTAEKGYQEENLVFLGLVAMEDTPREEVALSIQLAQKAGIKVMMITGDSKETAVSIAKQIGLSGNVLQGTQLDELSDEELKLAIKDIGILARVRPDHKIRVVKILKELGEIVSMTGDGVNDAPALKEAHIGIAMGKNGTDVSRSVADLVLKDDNFATIVNAIAEGRTAFNNLRKFMTYQLSCSLAELMTLFFGVLLAPALGWSTPILASIQILFMNIVTDNIPAITLGLNPSSNDVMDVRPRKSSGILNKVLLKLLIGTAILMTVITLVSYTIAFNYFGFSHNISQTTALVTLILLEIAIAFSYRSFRKRVLNRSLFVNKYLVYASTLSVVLTIVIIYTPLSVAFETVKIARLHWIIAITGMFIGIIVQDTMKYINNRNNDYLANTL